MSRGPISPLLTSLLLVLATGTGASGVGAFPGSGQAGSGDGQAAGDALRVAPAERSEKLASDDETPTAQVRVHRVVRTGDGWIAAGTRERPEEAGGGMELVMMAEEAGGNPREMEAPATSAPLVHDPEPLLATGADPTPLRGLAWLEGTERGRMAVRYARRAGDGWTAAETVAAPGDGSQLALSAAHLEDGTSLLVWSRFDGEDDEIFWSARAAGDGAPWSSPRRVAPGTEGTGNRVPDVTPVVTPVPGGAVAAWSGFVDGTYRVFTSRLDLSRLDLPRTDEAPTGTDLPWSTPRTTGPPGSVLPHFESPAEDPGTGTDGSPLLLFRTAEPRGWTVVEMDRQGTPRRTARAVHDGDGLPPRPRVIQADGAGVVLEWPAATATDEGGQAFHREGRSGTRLNLPWTPFADPANADRERAGGSR